MSLCASITPSTRTLAAIIRAHCFGIGKLECANHEIRHWAQIATLLRVKGTKADFQDFISSPVFGD
jgi:hypothetical protein